MELLAAVFLILLVNEWVGHTGDVVADDAGQGLVRGFLAVSAREVVGLFHPVGEEFSDDALGVFFLVDIDVVPLAGREVGEILDEAGFPVEAASVTIDTESSVTTTASARAR